MNKPRWISFCGWMALAALGVLVANILVNYGEKASPYHGRAAVGGIALMAFVPLLVLWMFGSVVHRFQVGAAKIKAAAMVDAQRKAGGLAQGPMSRPPL